MLKVFDTVINENSSSFYVATVKDELGVAIPGASLVTLTMTLFLRDTETNAIINGRTATNIKSKVDSSGVLTLEFTPNDNAILDAALPREWRECEFTFTFGAPTKTGVHRIQYAVVNLVKKS